MPVNISGNMVMGEDTITVKIYMWISSKME